MPVAAVVSDAHARAAVRLADLLASKPQRSREHALAEGRCAGRRHRVIRRLNLEDLFLESLEQLFAAVEPLARFERIRRSEPIPLCDRGEPAHDLVEFDADLFRLLVREVPPKALELDWKLISQFSMISWYCLPL
jgi:hypothetical protein